MDKVETMCPDCHSVITISKWSPLAVHKCEESAIITLYNFTEWTGCKSRAIDV